MDDKRYYNNYDAGRLRRYAILVTLISLLTTLVLTMASTTIAVLSKSASTAAFAVGVSFSARRPFCECAKLHFALETPSYKGDNLKSISRIRSPDSIVAFQDGVRSHGRIENIFCLNFT